MKYPKICVEYFNLKDANVEIDVNLFQKGLEFCEITEIEIDNSFFGDTNKKQICKIDGLKSMDFTISFLSKAEIAKINNDYRNMNKPTNVLSFEGYFVDDKTLNLGDIYICIDVIKDEAIEQGKSFADHYTHIVLHGFLHLLGFDHINDDDAKIMEDLEVKTLKFFNIKDPY